MGTQLKMVDKMRVLIALISCQILAISQAHSGVPVIIWGNSGAQLPTPRAAQATSNKDFLSHYLEPLANQNGHNLVTFVQDKLSLDDITQHGDVYNANSQGGSFHNLKGLVETHPSLSLPSVDHPAESIDKISNMKQHELKSPYDLSSLRLNPEGGNHIKVHLPASDSPAAMRDIDNVIGTVSAALKKLGPSFTAVYTGVRNSLIPQQVYSGRHLLAAEDSGNYTFFNLTADGASCLFFYTQQLSFTLRPNTSDSSMVNAPSYTWNLPNINTYDADGSKCGNGSATLKWSYTKDLPENVTSFSAMTKLELLSSGYWKMSEFAITYNTKIANGDNIPLHIRDIWAPQYYSYHCSEFRCSLSTASSSNVTGQQYIAQVDMDEFQIQFQIKNDQFGMANDCVGFFTIPIWMGLFTTLIMISILSYGILMLSSINTMDRFDDPKGKTISVPVGE